METIPRNRVYSEVAKQLQARIVNQLKPGDMLPSERELVLTFGVSRSSIRDAIRSLEAVGLLEPRQGVGTVVRELSSDAVVTPVASVLLQKRKVIHDLLEVRNIIEPALARRAALHASPEQITEMQAILRRQEEKIRRGELTIDEDSVFHYTLALAADNSMMMKLVGVLMDLLRETRERTLQGEGRPEKSLEGHLRILAAVERGDASGAEAAMRRHLSEIETIVLHKL
ncbi:MAG: FadR/GntR family transcriptional regulator [Candidatus Sulfotelmatobacter sp.]